MQTLQDLPLLSDTPMQKREVRILFVMCSVWRLIGVVVGSIQAKIAIVWSDIQL